MHRGLGPLGKRVCNLEGFCRYIPIFFYLFRRVCLSASHLFHGLSLFLFLLQVANSNASLYYRYRTTITAYGLPATSPRLINCGAKATNAELRVWEINKDGENFTVA
jgi:hypothetical protein